MAKADLTAQRLRELFDYDVSSGKFFNKSFRGGTSFAGKEAGCINTIGRHVISVDGVRYLRYRLAWLFVTGAWPANEIDHINGDQSDDRMENLRDVTRKINQQNIRRAQGNKKSHPLIGAYKEKYAKRWFSSITTNGEACHLGSFDTPEQAHAAYVEAKRRLHEGCTI